MQATKPITKPSKQRKMLFQAPDHIRYKFLAAPLSPELRKSHGAKTLPVRSGDLVRVLRGDHKGFEGKITRVDRRKYRIYVEGLTREKVDGTTIFVPIHPSKVMITRLNLEDKWRKKILERKKAVAVKELEKIPVKPPERITEIKEEIAEEKPSIEEKPKRKRRKVSKKPSAARKAKEKVEKAEKEEKPKTKKPKPKKTTKKTKGGE